MARQNSKYAICIIQNNIPTHIGIGCMPIKPPPTHLLIVDGGVAAGPVAARLQTLGRLSDLRVIEKLGASIPRVHSPDDRAFPNQEVILADGEPTRSPCQS